MTHQPITVILTRPLAQGKEFADLLHAQLPQIEVELSPLLRIEPVPGQVALDQAAGVILTSGNAVDAVNRQDLPVFCVGSATTDAAARAGLSAQDCGGTADALIETVLARRPDGPLVHLRGEHSRGQVAERLTKGGVPCSDAVVYRQVQQELSRKAQEFLGRSGRVILPIFSPRTAAIAAKECANSRADMTVVAISQATLLAWGDTGRANAIIAQRPDATAMLMAIKQAIAANGWLEA